MYYLRTVVSEDKMKELMDILIFDDPDMFDLLCNTRTAPKV